MRWRGASPQQRTVVWADRFLLLICSLVWIAVNWDGNGRLLFSSLIRISLTLHDNRSGPLTLYRARSPTFQRIRAVVLRRIEYFGWDRWGGWLRDRRVIGRNVQRTHRDIDVHVQAMHGKCWISGGWCLKFLVGEMGRRKHMCMLMVKRWRWWRGGRNWRTWIVRSEVHIWMGGWIMVGKHP